MQYKNSYLHHYLTSNSRHGTHSPFVYQLVDKVIYAVPLKSEKQYWSVFFDNFKSLEKKKRFLLVRLLQNFPFNNYNILSSNHDSNLQDVILYYQNTVMDRSFFYVDNYQFLDEVLIGRMEKDFIVVNEPYRSKEFLNAWHRVQKDPTVVVTIDLFHYGLIFFRREQRKENFKIRFNIKG